jgi:hypothetical protein
MLSIYSYRSRDAPHYYPGHGTLIATLSMSAVLSALMSAWLSRENARRDRVAQEKNLPLRAEEYTPEMLAKERESGDNATFFRYTI